MAEVREPLFVEVDTMGVSVDQGATQPELRDRPICDDIRSQRRCCVVVDATGHGSGSHHVSVDYPYQRNDEAVAFIDAAPMTGADRELICHGNAERVLKI